LAAETRWRLIVGRSGADKIEERREMWVPRSLNNMGKLIILNRIGADSGSVFSRKKMFCQWRDGDRVRAESIGHRLAAGHPVRRDEPGICCKMSVNESFLLVVRFFLAGRIKNRRKTANRSHDG
jgi:hypothetical protein